MRLFVAIEVPEGIRETLHAHCRSLAPDLPGARWVTPDRLHLTLVFLGETETPAIEPIQKVLTSVGDRHAAFSLQVTSPGAFPKRRPARVAWIGLEASSELTSLQRDLRESLCRKVGLTLDSRPYHPHLTMARCKRPWPRPAVERWHDSPLPVFERSFEVTYFDLMQSRLTPAGPHYSILTRVALRD